MSKISELESALKKEKSKQLFVSVFSPGTLFSEQDSFEVESRELKPILTKIKDITQRHGAKPYGFRFQDGNGKPLSGTYYITGRLIYFDEIPENDEDLRILRSNMRANDYPIVIENKNSYRFTGQFEEEDSIINWEGETITKGNEKVLVDYRAKQIKEFKKYYAKFS